MAIQKEDISQWVETLEDEDLSSYTSIQVRHWLEFYKVVEGRSVLKWENLEYRKDTLWAVYSPYSNVYQLMKTRDRWDAKGYSQELKTYYNDGNLYLLLDEPQMDELKVTLSKVYKHYTKREGSFKYRDLYHLLFLILGKEEYLHYNKGEEGYKTISLDYDNKINEILKK
jgi:hypothetical protein